MILFFVYIELNMFISYWIAMENKRFHKDKYLEETTTPEEDGPMHISQVLIMGAFTVASFYAYFAGYQLRFKNLNLGAYSFLVVGILFLIAFSYSFYTYLQEQKNNK